MRIRKHRFGVQTLVDFGLIERFTLGAYVTSLSDHDANEKANTMVDKELIRQNQGAPSFIRATICCCGRRFPIAPT